jgi:O-antigen/teichoic acid export membrane protein
VIALRPRRHRYSSGRPLSLNRLSTVHRNVAGSLGATLVVQASLLVNGIATARILGVLDRGHFALFMLVATVLPIVTTMGLPLSLTYWIARDPGLGRPLLRALQRMLAVQMLVTVAIHACVLYGFFHSSTHDVQLAAAVSLLASPAIALWSYGMSVLQANQQFKALNLSRMVSPAISAGVTATFLVAGVRGLFLITLVWVALQWLTAIVTGVAAVRGLALATAPADRAAMPPTRRLLSFGIKALLGSVTPLEGFQLDQAAVGIFISQQSLGLYVAAVAFTNLPRFISQNIGLVAYPHVAAGRDQRGQKRVVLGFVAMTLLLCGSTIVALELTLPFLVPHLFGAAFRPAVGVARILLVSALLFALRRVLSECARGAGRPALGSVAEVCSLITLPPALVLFYHHGAQGVAIALVVAAAAGLLGMLVGLLAGAPQRSWGGTEFSAAEPRDSLVTEV